MRICLHHEEWALSLSLSLCLSPFHSSLITQLVRPTPIIKRSFLVLLVQELVMHLVGPVVEAAAFLSCSSPVHGVKEEISIPPYLPSLHPFYAAQSS